MKKNLNKLTKQKNREPKKAKTYPIKEKTISRTPKMSLPKTILFITKSKTLSSHKKNTVLRGQKNKNNQKEARRKK